MSVPWELRPAFAPEVAAVPVQSLVVMLLTAPPWEELLSLSEAQSSIAILGYLPLAPVKSQVCQASKNRAPAIGQLPPNLRGRFLSQRLGEGNTGRNIYSFVVATAVLAR